MELEKIINYMIYKYLFIIYLMFRKNVLKIVILMIRIELFNKIYGVVNVINLS